MVENTEPYFLTITFTDERILGNRKKCIVAVLNAIRRHFRERYICQFKHTWVIDEKHDVSFVAEPWGIQATATPEEVTAAIKEAWLQARERHPAVLTGDGYRKLVSDRGTEHLSEKEFADLFKKQLRGS